LRAERGPGVEFLEYLTPPGARSLPDSSKPNDLVFWHTDLTVDNLDDLVSQLKQRGTRLLSARVVDLSRGDALLHGIMVRDPDGHALELLEGPAQTASTTKQ